MTSKTSTAVNIMRSAIADWTEWKRLLKGGMMLVAARKYSCRFEQTLADQPSVAARAPNPLLEYANTHCTGNGLWKWHHYYEIYHRHFQKFVGRKVDVLEIGVYSGGSLELWKNYFGDQCTVHGVDIEPACTCYAGSGIHIHVGDQGDRAFWRNFFSKVPGVDILIDDGGHTPEQQYVTLEEALPFIRPGGVYMCEDIHRSHNPFGFYAAGLIAELNQMEKKGQPLLQSRVSPYQKAIHSLHFYPYVLVIEKHDVGPEELYAPKYGTNWQPFSA